MGDLVLKECAAFEIKDADKGEVQAVIATLGVVDRDGDVITETAIKSGAKVKVSSYGHDAMYGAIPVGKGTIVIEGTKAIFAGRLFLATARGRETFDVLKEMGADQEWSFGFRVLGTEVPDDTWREKGAYRILTKLDAFEVSPVLIGAGKGTRTLQVKEADEAAAREASDRAAEETAAADAARVAAEAKALEEATLAKVADEEFERFQRTLRKFGHR